MSQPAASPRRRFPHAIFWPVLLVLACLAVGTNLFLQTRHERNALLATMAQMRQSNRAQLAAMWHVRVYKPYQFVKKTYADRIVWEPDATAPVAMAVTPRSAINEVDSIFQLYHGDAPQMLFALTSSGVFLDDQQVDLRRYPERKLARALTADELARLDELIALIRQRRDRFEKRSHQYVWLNQVFSTALDLRQSAAQSVM